MMEQSNDNKQLFRCVYHNAKTLDDLLLKTSTISEIFSSELLDKCIKLREKCEYLLFHDLENYGKKSREILWRQGCYNFVKTIKNILFKTNKTKLSDDELDKFTEFIFHSIKNFKRIILKFENLFNLDLRYLIDFKIIDIFDIDSKELNGVEISIDERTNLDSIDYALKTIHFMLIVLGDLNRYLHEFNVVYSESVKIQTIKLSSKFYYEAFKLNPTIGMAQNQLGTLLIGKNYDIDSAYHYLFSLSCKIPFELSENNVVKLFQKNINYVETIDAQNEDYEKLNLKDFIARFILMIDIFYFDKSVIDFNNLCHFVLMQLTKLINFRLSDFDENILYKITSILFFCMSNLKYKNSSKIHHLNAFMIALTSGLMDTCIKNIETYISDYSKINEAFQLNYQKLFDGYERKVALSRRCSDENRSEDIAKEIELKSDEEKDIVDPIKYDTKLNSKKPNPRRRRKKIHNSSESDSDDCLSDFESDLDEMDESDYDSDTESSSSENEENDYQKDNEHKVEERKISVSDENNSDVDVIVEEEKTIYMTGSDNEDIVIEEETIIYNDEEQDEEQKCNSPVKEKLKYLPKYQKVDPNIIIEFSKTEKCLKSLKILFDWLRNNIDILLKCYQTNPEFIQKMIKLLNYLNVDIFTKKVFFDLKMITIEHLRSNLSIIFDDRQKIPLKEDIEMKGFDLFESNQKSLDYEIHTRMNITDNEETLIRILKLVDFGFCVSKTNKFNYYFCKKTRNFIEGINIRNRRYNRDRRNRNRRGYNKYNNNNNNCRRSRRSSNLRHNKEENGFDDNYRGKTILLAKHETKPEMIVNGIENDNEKYTDKDKSMIMGKLWLKNEVENLESKVKIPATLNLTPYLVMDTKCFTDFTPIVRNLAKTKKFIILIPNAVFSDLDELKKHSEGARNAIRWLEQEFKKGNRFIRSQRDDETQILPMLKTPKKLDRESSIFLQITQFCYYIQKNNSSDDILTFLTGESISEKKCSFFSYDGILKSIALKTEFIAAFYAKYKNKK